MMSNRSRTARDGINAVEGIVIRQLGWVFREQPIEDVGVDAHVEICEGGKLTGRLIALQIKSGASWFREVTPRGFVYRGEPRHLEYWRSHSLPVVLVLYHPDEQRAWWVAIADDAIQNTPQGWKIIVPKDQEFNGSGVELLRRLALPDYTKRVEIIPQHSDSGQPTRQSPPLENLFHVLNSAMRRIEIASPFVSSHLFGALLPIVSRGVSVRILTGPNQPTNWMRDIVSRPPSYRMPDIRVWMPREDLGGQFHAKYVIVDEATVIFGSANFTLASWTNNVESVMAATDPKTVEQFKEQFENAWMSPEALPGREVFMASS